MRDAPAGAARTRLSPRPLTHYRLTMNFSARTVFVTLAAAVFGLAVAVGAARVTKYDTVTVPKYEPPQPGAEEKAERKPVGMAGCMAAACHGAPANKALNGDRGEECWSSSGSCWAAADPHTAAYSLLTDSPRHAVKVTAAQIMAKYRPGVRATDDARCLACHTNPALAEQKPKPEVVALREQGVSCEACHGNAGQWLQPHTRGGVSRTELKEKGLAPLSDLGERALACAGCHVGAPAGDNLPVRDMNHDMIAAGHPRLDFDFAEYQRRLPRHWQEKDRTKSPPEPRATNEAQVWYIGRISHAEAACRLLASRAERSDANDPRSPWPEFAEFNCAACHHNLHAATDEDDHWRKDEKNLNGRPIGSTPWQTIWPVTHAAGLDKPARANSEVAALVRLMEGETGQKGPDGQPRVNRHAKSGEAKALALATAEKLATLRRESVKTVPDPAVAAKAAEFFPKGAPLVPEWDSAGQLFFGLAALEYAKGPPDAAAVKKFGAGAAAFRARQFPPSKTDWANVKAAFEAIR